MKHICILTCMLMIGTLGSANASVAEKSGLKAGLLPYSTDAFSSSDEESSYSTGLVISEDDLSVDKAKKKKKKKKTRAS